MNTNDPFSTVRVPVDPDLATTASASPDPDPRQDWYPELYATLHGLMRRHLDALPGYFVLTGLDHLSERQARDFTVAVSRMAA